LQREGYPQIAQISVLGWSGRDISLRNAQMGIVAAARLRQAFVAAEHVLLFNFDCRRAEACEGGFQLRNPREGS
jgi:hypothetical protein